LQKIENYKEIYRKNKMNNKIKLIAIIDKIQKKYNYPQIQRNLVNNKNYSINILNIIKFFEKGKN
jgi:hypothetical protein